VHHESAFRAQLAERPRHEFYHPGREHSCHLCPRPGWIRQRPQKIEYGSSLELLPSLHRMFHGRVNHWRKEKSDSHALHRFAHAQRRKRDAYAQRFEHVGGAATRTDRAVPVLGYSCARAGRHECGAGGNIECAFAVAARPAGVHQPLLSRAARGGKHGSRMAPHRRGESHHFFDGFTFLAKCGE